MLYNLLAVILLVLLGSVSFLLGKSPHPETQAHRREWTQVPWWQGRTRLTVALAGAAVLSSDIHLFQPRWLGIVVVALPCFLVGLIVNRRSQSQR